MPNVELDDEFLELFFNLTNSAVPKELSTIVLKRQLIEIVDIIQNLNKNTKTPYISRGLNNEPDESEESQAPAILVVDDLGVITYQLKVLLSRFDYDVDCSQEIYDAVNKFKKRTYKYVVMDLFIPTEREGFILLTELKKMAQSNGNDTVIGVITASPRKEIEIQCKSRGADFFIEKNNDWQNTLYNIMDEYINVANVNEEDD